MKRLSMSRIISPQLLALAGVLFFNWLVQDPERQPTWVVEAKSKPLLDQLGTQLVNMLPDNADALILDGIRGDQVDVEAEAGAPPSGNAEIGNN